jgi:hypothetical protein
MLKQNDLALGHYIYIIKVRDNRTLIFFSRWYALDTLFPSRLSNATCLFKVQPQREPNGGFTFVYPFCMILVH